LERAEPRLMSLTASHIARIARKVDDSGLPPGLSPQTDEDYRGWVETIVQTHPAAQQPTQLFAYGSLIWKPEILHVGECPATALHWHRAFCFRMPRFRGTPEKPGLMMALDEGGSCDGILYQLPHADLERQLDTLFRREFTMKPVNSMPRWIKVNTGTGQVDALAFVMNRQSPLYAPDLTLDDVAEILSYACGHWGTGAEYLLNTVACLEEKGIHDHNLWALQHLLATKIEKLLPHDD
jgi:glutathione-specific gamma-glutamylcyclotransferase